MTKRRPDEGRYSKVTRRIWNSADFRALSCAKPNAQTLFMRLLTGPELGLIPGLYEMREGGMAEALGWPVAAFRRCFKEITDRGMAFHDKAAGLIWIPKAIVHNPPDNPNVITGWKTAWKEIPACELKDEAREGLRDWCAAKGNAWAEAFDSATCRQNANVGGNPFPNPSPNVGGNPHPNHGGNQEQEQEQEQEVGRETLPPPNPNPPPDPDLVWLTKQAALRGWMGSLFASERTKQAGFRVVDLAQNTALQRGVPGWRPVFERVFSAWIREKPERINLPNWPSKLAEDWHQCVTRVDSEQPS